MSEHIYVSKKAIELLRKRGEIVERDGKIYYDEMEVIEIVPEVKHEVQNHS